MDDPSGNAMRDEYRQVPCFAPSQIGGELIFVSGQMAFGSDGKIVGSDVAAQTRRCIENIHSILQRRQLALSAVVKTTVWLRNAGDFWDFNMTYAEFFDRDALPARSTVCAELIMPGALVEIEAVAATQSRRL